jgi:hypothetical protein
VSELRRAPSAAQWWLARYQAISLLKGNAPRLFEALTTHYRLVTGREAAGISPSPVSPWREG